MTHYPFYRWRDRGYVVKWFTRVTHKLHERVRLQTQAVWPPVPSLQLLYYVPHRPTTFLKKRFLSNQFYSWKITLKIITNVLSKCQVYLKSFIPSTCLFFQKLWTNMFTFSHWLPLSFLKCCLLLSPCPLMSSQQCYIFPFPASSSSQPFCQIIFFLIWKNS